jgi:dynein heavy chain, axonemal
LSPDEVSIQITADILDRFGEKKFDVEEIARSIDDIGPYQNVFMQEMEVMNNLLSEIVRSLKELQLGFNGELTMSDSMDMLKSCLYLDKIPPLWQKRAWPSLRPLQSWLNDFTYRLNQLDDWQNNPLTIPKVTWISGLYNPQSFLTAIMQVTAKFFSYELDKLITWTDVTKKVSIDEVDSLAKEGGVYHRSQHAGCSMGCQRRDDRAIEA